MDSDIPHFLKHRKNREYWPDYSLTVSHLGTGDATKLDEFSEKVQTAFERPPPSFFESHIAFFPKKNHLNLCLKIQNLQHKFLD